MRKTPNKRELKKSQMDDFSKLYRDYRIILYEYEKSYFLTVKTTYPVYINVNANYNNDSISRIMSNTYVKNNFNSVFRFYKACFDNGLSVNFYVSNDKNIINYLLSEDLTIREIGLNLLYDKNNIRKLV